VNFKDTVVIMTSNIGANYLLDGVNKNGDLQESARKSVMEALRSHFRPELLNRIDDIVLFKPLKLDEIKRIVTLLTKSLSERLKDRHISLELTDRAITFIATSAYDPVYGARPLKRYLQRDLETKIGRALIGGGIREGSCVIVDRQDGSANEGLSVTVSGGQ
jgi:ATP-dependent Clp protease ATP-binding subunit ClpB